MRRLQGIRFRIVDEQDSSRPHLRIFVNEEKTRTLDAEILPSDRVLIFAALERRLTTQSGHAGDQ